MSGMSNGVTRILVPINEIIKHRGNRVATLRMKISRGTMDKDVTTVAKMGIDLDMAPTIIKNCMGPLITILLAFFLASALPTLLCKINRLRGEMKAK